MKDNWYNESTLVNCLGKINGIRRYQKQKKKNDGILLLLDDWIQDTLIEGDLLFGIVPQTLLT